jgi:outer membrane murein-binding lipoprotein Lpp
VRALVLLAAVAAAALLIAGCGAPAKLDADQKKTLAGARERLDEAIDTEEAMRSSRAEARHRVRAVRRRLGGPGLGEVEDAAPALVDGGDVRDFLRYGRRDPARALHPPAARQVLAIASTLHDKAPDTKIGDQSAAAFLGDAAKDTRSIWPDLSRRLQKARDDLN